MILDLTSVLSFLWKFGIIGMSLALFIYNAYKVMKIYISVQSNAAASQSIQNTLSIPADPALYQPRTFSQYLADSCLLVLQCISVFYLTSTLNEYIGYIFKFILFLHAAILCIQCIIESLESNKKDEVSMLLPIYFTYVVCVAYASFLYFLGIFFVVNWDSWMYMLPVICIALMSFLHLKLKKDNNIYPPLIAIIIIAIIRAGTIYIKPSLLIYSYVYNIALPIIMLCFALLELYLYFTSNNNSAQRRTTIAYIMNLISSDIFKCLYGFIYILSFVMTCVMTLNACVYIVSIPMGNDILAANFVKTQRSVAFTITDNNNITFSVDDPFTIQFDKTKQTEYDGASATYYITIYAQMISHNIVIAKTGNTYIAIEEPKPGQSQFNGTLTITDSQGKQTQLSIKPSLISANS